jgi:DNA-binding response OmpR family regulator
MPRAAANVAGDAATPLRRSTDVPRHTDSSSEAPALPRRRADDVASTTPGNSPAEPGSVAGFGRRQSDATGVVRHGPLVVEAEGRSASLDGVELVLTRTEFDLLEALVGAPRRVWTRKALLTKVWGTEWPMDEHLVEVHIGNLRRKLGDKGREPRFIRTVRGVGYRMAPAEVVV